MVTSLVASDVILLLLVLPPHYALPHITRRLAGQQEWIQPGNGHVDHVGVDQAASEDGAQSTLAHMQQLVDQLADEGVAGQERGAVVAGNKDQVQLGQAAEGVP